jgi:hypothetical protein
MTTFNVIKTTDIFGNPDTLIQKINDDGTIWAVPSDPANSDYQAYLATLASELSNPSTPQAGE